MLQSEDPFRPEPARIQSASTIPSFSHYPAIPAPVAVSLTTLSDHACAYLPGQTARSRALWASRLPGDLYQQFMDAGFRRSGKVIYQPICAGCRACVPIRVPVNRFAPDKSQRRCLRRNRNIAVTVDSPAATDEAYALYSRYVRQWHGCRSAADAPAGDSVQEDSRTAFERFLYESPVESLEFKYRQSSGENAGKLLAVGICDAADTGLSSVYFYFDPEEAHLSLGTFGALYELDFARTKCIEYYYLGYWIEGCGTMQYKSRFRPFELLGTDGKWVAGG
jgi:arginyl-tRNA--protein-N-Asp/Glu arginylyltransferase